jgi:hypothetical protein
MAADKKYRCPNCGAIHYGMPAKVGRAKVCQRCQCLFDKRTWPIEEIEDWERMPSLDPCPTCQKELEGMREAVEAGGVYWRCSKCGESGVFSPEHKFAIQARKQAKVPAPQALGVELDEKNCPVCTGQVEGGAEHLLGEGSKV